MTCPFCNLHFSTRDTLSFSCTMDIMSAPAVQDTSQNPVQPDDWKARYYLDVPFAQKETAKALGAWWDPVMRMW